jgi:predicted DCC family thiol-disulfide oxidoreductase YuxK
MSNEATARVTMLYDGSCPLCSKEVAHYRRVDKKGQVNWVDIATDQQVLEQHAIGFDAAMRHLHVVTADGGIVKGAYAFAEVWRALPRYRILAKLVSIPGILPLLDRAYQRFANWRYDRRMQCDSCGIR